MITIRKSFIFVVVLLLCIQFCCGQGNAAKPKFPPVFQVEVQGIFKNVKKEMVGTIYYDSLNNRGAFRFTYQGINTKNIYRFDDNELLQISGTKCNVTSIRNDSANIFFPFSTNWNGKTILAKPEELFSFTNSIFVSEGSDFPSYVYKAEWKPPVDDGSKCEVTHVFTKPEMKVPECNSNTCQPTLATMNINCSNKDGSLGMDTTYDFFRFKPSIVDANVFLPPSGVFCNVRNKNKFPGLPDYFSFSYDLTNERKGTDRTSGVTVHKKVWYDSNMNILRMDEFDAERVQIASRIYDINGGMAYTSRTSLSACEIVSINNKDIPLDEITKLPMVFFQDERALSKALFVGTRHVHGLDYEVWSLSSDNKQTSENIVQEFYFSKGVPKSGVSETLKLSRAEIYTYQTDKRDKKSEQPEFTYLPVNNFIDRLRWEAFDVSSCFESGQKREFKLKVDGPPTVKDSKIFQEVLNKLYTNLIQATNISAVRFTNLACVHDGVKIVEFTGLILDKSKVISSDTGKYELDMNDAYRMIDYLASNKKLSLKMSMNGQIVEYKITAIEDIKHEEEDKNLYSGGVVAACVFGCTPLAIFAGAFISIQIQKRRYDKDSDPSPPTGPIGLEYERMEGRTLDENDSFSCDPVDENDSFACDSVDENNLFGNSMKLKPIKS